MCFEGGRIESVDGVSYGLVIMHCGRGGGGLGDIISPRKVSDDMFLDGRSLSETTC